MFYVDRIKVRPELQQRLAESFEAALRLANGRAIALEMEAVKETPSIENDSTTNKVEPGCRDGGEGRLVKSPPYAEPL